MTQHPAIPFMRSRPPPRPKFEYLENYEGDENEDECGELTSSTKDFRAPTPGQVFGVKSASMQVDALPFDHAAEAYYSRCFWYLGRAVRHHLAHDRKVS